MIVSWLSDEVKEVMPSDILVELRDVVCRHPWWRERARLTVELLRDAGVRTSAKVLDVGCGWGVTLEAVAQAGFYGVGLDVSRIALEKLDRPGRMLLHADVTQSIPSGADTFDAVLALDVIEHVDDDRRAIANLAVLTRPGGVVIVSVPALPHLYSEFDEVQGHRRRYVPERLAEAFAGSELHVKRMFWWGSWMVPLLKLRRRPTGRSHKPREGESAAALYRRYLRVPPRPFVWLVHFAFACERRRALKGRLRTGTSLFVVAERLVKGRQPSRLDSVS